MAHRVEPKDIATAGHPRAVAKRLGRGDLRARRSRVSPEAPGGFTLVELLIALALGGIMLALAVPAYADWIATSQLANHAQLLATSLTLARSEAIKRGARVSVCPAADGRHCGDAGWEAGWVVFVDANRDGRNADDEPLLRAEAAAAAGISVRANQPVADYVSFTALGHARLTNGGLQMGTFTLCRRGLPAQKVVLANSGRVRVEKSRDVCTD